MDFDKTWQPSQQGFVVTFWPVHYFVEPAKPEKLVDFEKQPPCFASGNVVCERNRESRKQSLHYFYYSLEHMFWSVCFLPKVRWSSEHFFSSAFESLCGFSQQNHPVFLYSSALWDAPHIRIKFLLVLCEQTSCTLRWLLQVSAK